MGSMASRCVTYGCRARERPAATHLAVDEGRGDDQEPLEDVLPLLVEAEEHRRVQDLNAEPRAHQRPDEGASPAEQARPAEHDGGDRGQRVAGALSRVADAELREQDDRAAEREQRGAQVAEQRRPVDRHADAPRRLLVRADRAQPHAEARLAQHELERQGGRATKTMKAIGTGPTFVEMRSVTDAAM